MTRADAKPIALRLVRGWRNRSRPWTAGEPLDISEAQYVRNERGEIVANIVHGVPIPGDRVRVDYEARTLDVLNERGEVAARVLLNTDTGWDVN